MFQNAISLIISIDFVFLKIHYFKDPVLSFSFRSLLAGLIDRTCFLFLRRSRSFSLEAWEAKREVKVSDNSNSWQFQLLMDPTSTEAQQVSQASDVDLWSSAGFGIIFLFSFLLDFQFCYDSLSTLETLHLINVYSISFS